MSGCADNVIDHLCKYIGETVTIFTESGGQSGSGFTGVVLFVSPCFVRLISCIGPAPNCALGNACDGLGFPYGYGSKCDPKCKGEYSGHYSNVGSVTDIPTDKIVAFVHNAV